MEHDLVSIWSEREDLKWVVGAAGYVLPHRFTHSYNLYGDAGILAGCSNTKKREDIILGDYERAEEQEGEVTGCSLESLRGHDNRRVWSEEAGIFLVRFWRVGYLVESFEEGLHILGDGDAVGVFGGVLHSIQGL